ncbi:synaptonemal complex protein 2 [Suncus etruscus]|uniref:synaptonemal complex protein 2 n=1 Tax=Suncus etruscus TaxID=109475 RepID=UPI002110A013|nr:synaptonemal complex protein 2 [Suncus etruscus]
MCGAKDQPYARPTSTLLLYCLSRPHKYLQYFIQEQFDYNVLSLKESKKLLTIILKTIVKISKIAGKQLLFYFDASLDIINVTQKIFGANKYREFTKKQSFSIAKTSVHVIFDESGSQNPVPKSQNSPVRDLSNLKEKSDSQIEIAKLLKCTKNSLHGESKNNQPQIVKHRKRKISEASIIVPGSDRYTVRSPIFLINTPTERRKRSKSPVPVMRSIEKPDLCRTLENKVDNAVSMKSRPSEGRKRDNISDKLMKPAQIVGKQTEKDIESPNQSFNELSDMPPDSQTVGKIGESMLPGVLNSCGNKMQSKLACWTPIMNIKLCKKQQESASSEDSFNQEIVLNKNHTKEKSSTSISDDNYEETERMPERKEIMKQSKKEKAEIEDLERNCQQGLNYSKQKNIAYTNQSGCLIEPEITLKSVHLNKTIEESLTYRKRYILSKDVTHDASEKSPRKSAESHTRQSRKGSTSKLNSWVLEKVKKKEESKENRFTDAAESLINQINKRYTPKESMLSARRSKESSVENDFSNKSDLLLRKEKVQKKTYRQLKTTLVNVAPQCPLNDVYNFNLNGADEPVIKLGIQELQATEAYMENSIKLTGLRNHNNTLKTKDKRVKNQKSKNVFSDSDTEIRCDDSKTDVSWLKEPKKPQLMDYSRTAKEKRRKPTKANVEERTERVLTHNYDRIRKFSSPYQKIPSPESVKNKSGVEGSTESPINHEKNFLHTRKCCSPIPKCFSLESSSQSSLFLSSNRREKAEQSLPPVTTTQESGPTHLTRKRLYLEDNLSNLKETEEQEEGRGSCIPAKQSKTEDLEPHFDPRNNLCIPEEHWEVENSNVEMIYEKANTEIKKKVKIHEKLMKYFTKESWKTAQQHVNSVKHHIQEYRIKKLDKFQFIIIEELEKFERDSQTLKNLEQEFAEFWEKIYQKFTSYQKCEQQRLHLLKTSLEKNVFYNTDYEETVFKAEMCSMKEDMKMLQERLLKEMQEEDLLNVRKGLVSLFMTYE